MKRSSLPLEADGTILLTEKSQENSTLSSSSKNTSSSAPKSGPKKLVTILKKLSGVGGKEKKFLENSSGSNSNTPKTQRKAQSHYNNHQPSITTHNSVNHEIHNTQQTAAQSSPSNQKYDRNSPELVSVSSKNSVSSNKSIEEERGILKTTLSSTSPGGEAALKIAKPGAAACFDPNKCTTKSLNEIQDHLKTICIQMKLEITTNKYETIYYCKDGEKGVKFEMEIYKFQKHSTLKGVKFKRVKGDPFEWKEIHDKFCSQIHL